MNIESLKEKTYSYQELELIAMKYGVKCSEYATIGMNEMPGFELHLPEIYKWLEDEINEKGRAEEISTGANRKYERSPVDDGPE